MELALNQSIIDSVTYYIGNKYIILFLLSMLPVTELRLSIPIGIIIFKLSWVYVLIVCVISNILAGVLLVVGLGRVISVCEKIPGIKVILKKMMILSEKRYSKYERYKSKALILFVGIPMPGTGAWTGSLASHVLGLSKISSILAIIQGVIISGVIMTLLSLSGKIIIG